MAPAASYKVQERAPVGQEEDHEPNGEDHGHLLLHASTYRQNAAKLRAAYHHHRERLNVGNLEREQSFSWLYCFFALFAYALMLSDVFRTGFGIEKVPYPSIEPDTYKYFGPYGYVTKHLTTANATITDTGKFWAYKYDTTSMTMRSIAEHLQLKAWPPCVLYKEHCNEEKGIPFATIFGMIESLVEGVSKHEGIHSTRHDRSRSRGVITLRIETEYRDRVHHYALPWFFDRNTIHTSQGIHFTYNASRPCTSSCSDLAMARRPYSCTQNWGNFRRLGCTNSASDDPAVCQPGAPRLWDLIPRRIDFLAANYPNHTIDYVILDGMDDYKRGGLSFQGRKTGVDVVVFSRIRKCDPVTAVCKTVAVDDYRYEAASFVMSAPAWFFTVAVLRGVAQLYAWLRLTMLIVGTCVARMREQRFRDATLTARVIVTLRTVFLIPSQVVIYGCSLPISLYLLAHLIDSPAAYELVAAYFTSILGQMNWSMSVIIQQCAISMRTVWVVGFLCHRLVGLTTSSSWSPTHGVPGASEFSITFIASLTIFAQYRALSFRRIRILQIYEIPPSARRAQRFADAVSSHRSTINNMIGGTTVDAQCLLCGFCGLLSISLFVWIVNRTFPKHMPLHLTLASNTIAPYSAGALWPRNRLVVSWYGSALSFERQTVNLAKRKPSTAASRVRSTSVASQAALGSMKQAQRLVRVFLDAPDKAVVMRENTISRLFQRDMYSMDQRTREVDSTVYLVNLAAMTDLFTFFDLRVADGQLVGLFQSKATRRCFLLPYKLVLSEADIAIDWNELVLVAVVNSKDMDWSDLLRCG